MQQPNFWFKENTLPSKLLQPLAKIWNSKTVSTQKNKGIKANKPVLCIGNVTIGGTGKTPMSIWTIEHMQKIGLNPLVLSRGYKGKQKKPIYVTANTPVQICGDEAKIIAKYGNIITYRNRAKSYLYAKDELKLKFDAIILDDGFHHNSIQKDYNICTIDGINGFGNELVIPAGPLREQLDSALKRVNEALIIYPNKEKACNDVNEKVITQLQKHNIPYCSAYFTSNDNAVAHNNNYFAFCALGNGEKFFQTLQYYGYNILKTKKFPDHYSYKQKELDNIINYAQKHNLSIITTQKDIVKIPKSYHQYINVLHVSLEFCNQNQPLKSFFEKLES